MIIRRLSVLLLLCVATGSSLFAQEWAPVGSKWYYTQQYFSPNTGVKTMEVVGDTTINDQSCRIIEGGEGCSLKFRFAYRENRRIYYFNDFTSSFQLLYDFNLVAGDTLKIFLPENAEDLDTFYLKIDSLSQIVLNDDTLQVQHVHSLPSSNLALEFGNKIYEDIGGNDFFLPVYGFCDIPPRPLRCFEHPNLGLYQFLPEFPCDYVPVREQENPEMITVYPNPTKEQLSINSLEMMISAVIVTDINGRLVHGAGDINNLNYTYNAADLPPGIYFLQAKLANGQAVFRKFFKK